MITVLIDGTDRSDYVMAKTISIDDTINERSTASMSMFDKNGLYRPEIGESVEVYDGATLLFGGTVDDLPEQEISGTGALHYANMPLVDYTEIADRRIVAESFTNVTAGSIVSYIITNYLADDGITAGDIQDGPIVSKAIFNYMSASQCCDELSELTGFQWCINYDKSLDFFDRTSYTGTAITASSAIRKLKVTKNRDQYRNRQYLKAGFDISETQIRDFKGDGSTQVFTVDLPMAEEPTVTVNSVAKTVGIRGLETGCDFYWQKNDKMLSQDDGDTKLTSSDTLRISYKGFYPIIVVADNHSEILARQAVEGGTGIYEQIEEKASIDNRDSAFEYANGILRRYANIQTTVELSTFTPYEAGQIVDVTLPIHAISEQMLVAQVTIKDIGAHQVEYTVRLVSGEAFGGWVSFFKKLASAGKTFTIRENEILIKMQNFEDDFLNLSMTEDMTYHLHQYLICGNSTICGEDVII